MAETSKRNGDLVYDGVNFSAFERSWNSYVSMNPTAKVRMKKANQLKSHWNDSHKKLLNGRATMARVREHDSRLNQSLRTSSTQDHGIVFQTAPPTTSLQCRGATSTAATTTFLATTSASPGATRSPTRSIIGASAGNTTTPQQPQRSDAPDRRSPRLAARRHVLTPPLVPSSSPSLNDGSSAGATLDPSYGQPPAVATTTTPSSPPSGDKRSSSQAGLPDQASLASVPKRRRGQHACSRCGHIRRAYPDHHPQRLGKGDVSCSVARQLPKGEKYTKGRCHYNCHKCSSYSKA